MLKICKTEDGTEVEAEQLSAQIELMEKIADLRVKKLLTIVRFEPVSERETLLSSREHIKEEELLFRYVCQVCLLLFHQSPTAQVRDMVLNTTTNKRETRDEIHRKAGVIERPEEAVAKKVREESADAYNSCNMKVDRHRSDKRLEEMSKRNWHTLRKDFNISYKGSRTSRPMRSWEESKLTSEFLRAMERAGYKTRSSIEMEAIPLGLQQHDVIGFAEIGSYAVLIAPTRERAQNFAHFLGLRMVSIAGGQSIQEQGLKRTLGCEIVIAILGCLIDYLERRYGVLNQCNYIVLDEADRMRDMGFKLQVADVLDVMPLSNLKAENEEEKLNEKKIYINTYMSGATMSRGKERLARKYLRNSVVITIGIA